ncbi:hypothetical protein [Proteiniclasticum ruminis]|uniref:hypothetical protein n=1 Tax=Proteiniclasticum ruminis TaxID=398199 RepID=UPI0028A93005|nr:hypothetical protein [Proteiniclasticum ruminis]
MDELQQNKEEFAVIHYDKNSYFANLIHDLGYTVVSAYKKINFAKRVIRKIHFKSSCPKKEIWFNKKYDLDKFDSLIIFDAAVNYELVKYIKKIYPDKRVILWYWNPVRNSIDPTLLSSEICEKWSYSLEDCKKYNLKYNTTFYFEELTNIYKGKDRNELCYDILFVGRDKGRLSMLLEYKEKFESLGLETNFHITPTKWYEKRKNKVYMNDISYNEIINLIKKSKAILDIMQNETDGLTLRAMESLFFERKLITNNQTIVQYDFYSKDNIFVLGIDKIDNLLEFIELPYKPISNHIVKKYEFSTWLDRFNL